MNDIRLLYLLYFLIMIKITSTFNKKNYYSELEINNIINQKIKNYR